LSAASLPPPPSLGTLLDNLGAGVVRVITAPGGLDQAVSDVVIHDPAEPPALQKGDVVLAVGIDPARRDGAALVEAAAAAGAAAVVLKIRPGTEPAQGTVEAAADGKRSTAVLGVDRDLTWAQLHGLLRTARMTSGEAPPAGLGSVPVGDLFSLANAVAAMVGGAVTIEDPHSSVLAYSSLEAPIDEARRETILGRRIPEQWMARLRESGVFRRLWSEDEAVRVDFQMEGFLPRLVAPVKAGDEVLGTIWVVEGSTPFTEEAEAALLEASRIAALHLIRHRSGEDIDRRRRGELLREALEGRTPAELLGPELGLANNAMLTAVAFQVAEGAEAEEAAQAERVAGLIALYCEAYRRQATAVAVGSRVYVVLPGDSDPGSLVKLSVDICERTETALGVNLRAGVGSTMKGLSRLTEARREADLALLAGGGAGTVSHIDDVRPRAVLQELVELAAGRHSLMEGRLDVIVEHDRAHGTDYLATLRAHLDAGGDARLVGELLGVHPNTYRYRLRRLAEISGLDLDDPVERLVTHLQLHIRDRLT
jgi:hypothetical protein